MQRYNNQFSREGRKAASSQLQAAEVLPFRQVSTEVMSRDEHLKPTPLGQVMVAEQPSHRLHCFQELVLTTVLSTSAQTASEAVLQALSVPQPHTYINH